jgi:DNA-binding MarR family transcriptional regulator
MPSLLGTQVHSADLADAVSRLRRAMRRAARAADPGSGLSVAQLEMLSCMAENPGSRPGQLARLLRLAPSSVATLSNSLRQAGLVTRTGGAGDRRTASLDLTPAGEAAVLRWKSLNERLLSLALRELPPDSRVTLVDALPALADLAGAVDALADEPSATDPLADEPSATDPLASGTSLAGETSLA